ncbi:hypothetical protein cyc_02149 [Cyclospora cayetanensis]|uniref:Uncharacterized protein n=1 Tax=Cyclospora cayetanensis TaxID=88456 RepID=A0A1D3CTU1_9EIME|nr:hypothetical protein cyc_02149 [Cyclospora cayetanensis]
MGRNRSYMSAGSHPTHEPLNSAGRLSGSTSSSGSEMQSSNLIGLLLDFLERLGNAIPHLRMQLQPDGERRGVRLPAGTKSAERLKECSSERAAVPQHAEFASADFLRPGRALPPYRTSARREGGAISSTETLPMSLGRRQRVIPRLHDCHFRRFRPC